MVGIEPTLFAPKANALPLRYNKKLEIKFIRAYLHVAEDRYARDEGQN